MGGGLFRRFFSQACLSRERVMAETELRDLARRKSLKRVRLVRDGSGGIGIECLVVDINSRGARLRFNSPLLNVSISRIKGDTCGNSKLFSVLYASGKTRGAVAAGTEVHLLFIPEHVCASGWVAWQNDCEIGVEFTRPLP